MQNRQQPCTTLTQITYKFRNCAVVEKTWCTHECLFLSPKNDNFYCTQNCLFLSRTRNIVDASLWSRQSSTSIYLFFLLLMRSIQFSSFLWCETSQVGTNKTICYRNYALMSSRCVVGVTVKKDFRLMINSFGWLLNFFLFAFFLQIV